MPSYGDHLASTARLKILQLLRKSGEQPLNHELLQLALESMAIRMTADQVRAELNWLKDVHAVTLVDVGPLVVADLTERGADIARGLATIPGVDRHVPGSGR
jgi:Fe2+ or Zn2+ uptake regulation protein